jgi:hypothetical protein
MSLRAIVSHRRLKMLQVPKQSQRDCATTPSLTSLCHGRTTHYRPPLPFECSFVVSETLVTRCLKFSLKENA